MFTTRFLFTLCATTTAYMVADSSDCEYPITTGEPITEDEVTTTPEPTAEPTPEPTLEPTSEPTREYELTYTTSEPASESTAEPKAEGELAYASMAPTMIPSSETQTLRCRDFKFS